MLHITILTLFPEIFPGPLGCSLAGTALKQGLWKLDVLQIRDFTEDKHRTVDDKPFGGGAGMVMRADILGRAIDHIVAKQPQDKIIYFSPGGTVMSQPQIHSLKELNHITMICGRFEGVDERLIEEYDIQLISLGDFILSGGEIPALALIDACVRLIPGVLGSEQTLEEESFSVSGEYAGLLEYPHYTRPSLWKGRAVPEILLSGNHLEIKNWRLEKAKEMTKIRRRDLWEQYKQQ